MRHGWRIFPGQGSLAYAVPKRRSRWSISIACRLQDPAGVRRMLGDGNYGGFCQRSDEEMLAIWAVAVEETRALIEGPWA